MANITPVLGLIKISTKAAFVALVFCYCALYTALWINLFNLITPFMFQYLLCGAVFVLLFILLKQKYWMVASLLLTLLFGTEYISANKLLHSTASPSDNIYALDIVSCNQLHLNQDGIDVLESSQTLKSDLLVIFEANKITGAAAEAKAVKAIFPYKYAALGLYSKSMLILSRWPLKDVERFATVENDPAQNYILRFQIQPDGASRPVEIYAFHAKSPIPLRRIAERNHELDVLGALIKQDSAETDLPRIALGDFNITPYNPHFKQLLQTSALSMPRAGLRPIHSWPSFAPWIGRFQIDHILLSDEITNQSIKTTPAFGSDHLGIAVKLHIEN
jgi:endonuclease/exonuclease/phosphatase family metal-dependent hydrolase